MKANMPLHRPHEVVGHIWTYIWGAMATANRIIDFKRGRVLKKNLLFGKLAPLEL